MSLAPWHLANELKTLGFRYATRSGVSIAIQDLFVPQEKKDIIAKAEGEIEQARRDYLHGCVFRSKASTDSGTNRSLIPE
jgi:DNA-directed RNA polymerase subunit beta'